MKSLIATQQSAVAYRKYLNHFLEWCRVFAKCKKRENVKM